MARRVSFFTSLSIGLLLVGSTWGCSKAGQPPAQQADGSYLFSCNGPLTSCLEQAERLCKDEGYTVMGHDGRELLGHESGQSQVEIHKSEANVRCGKPTSSALRPMVELKTEAPLSSDAKPSSPDASLPKPLACVPGSTQTCTGPGGCKGGQACASDGSRYDTCDCGKLLTPPEVP